MDRIEIEFPGIQRVIITDIEVGYPVLKGGLFDTTKLERCRAIWDTGSTRTVITRRVVNEFDLKPIGKSEVFGITGSSTENVYLISLTLPNRLQIVSVSVIECQSLGRNVDVLVGMDIISHGDMALTNCGGVTKFYFQLPSKGNIVF